MPSRPSFPDCLSTNESQEQDWAAAPWGEALPHSPSPCRYSLLPWHSLLCFPICLSPFLTSPPCPSSPSSLLLLPHLFCAALPSWLPPQPCWMDGLLPSPSHTADAPRQVSAKRSWSALTLSSPISYHQQTSSLVWICGPTTIEGKAGRVGSGCFKASLSLNGAGAALT